MRLDKTGKRISIDIRSYKTWDGKEFRGGVILFDPRPGACVSAPPPWQRNAVKQSDRPVKPPRFGAFPAGILRMRRWGMRGSPGLALTVLVSSALLAGHVAAAPGEEGSGSESGVQLLRFVQDDAQDYMVSKIYVLKYAQSNDLMPFVAGMIKRYNMNSSVSCIEYGSQNEQILTVTCPVGMMP